MIIADIWALWSTSWPAGLTMVGLGAGFAVVLLIASERLKVTVDPKIEQVHKVLPHLDCGACGFGGCSRYAKALLEDPQLIGKCAPGGPVTAAKVAEVLNIQVRTDGFPFRPIVHCRAHKDDKTYYAKYQGIQSCTAANALAPVQACKFGCLGFGDCTRACKFHALDIVNGLATIDYEKCTGCTACAKTCPRNLIQMVPFGCENMMTVACRNKESSKVTRSMCKVGCIGCGLCVKQSDIFTVEDNLARIDYQKYRPNEQNEAAMNKCPTGVIVYRGRTAQQPRQPGQKHAAALKT
jgi:electron transport complex protein RnfB